MTGPNLPTGYNLASPLPLSSVCIPSMRLKAALLPRGIVGKARKMRLETRHGEIHECPDLRNGQPALRGNEVHGHCGVLVLREKDLQRGLRNLLSNMIGKKSGDAASIDG